MSLLEEKCIPCHNKDIKAMKEKDVKLMLQQLDGWDAQESYSKISKKFIFKNFKQSFDFVTIISQIAEEEKHHPDITFGWGYCCVTIQTHAINGLHHNDFILAAKINNSC